MTTTSEPSTIDDQAVEEFVGRLFEVFTGAALSCLIDIGHCTGLFKAAAEAPATSAELATRAGVDERYVREWLGAMVTAGIFEYEPSVTSYWLPREHAVCLTGDRVENLAPVALLTTLLARHVNGVTDAFRHGGGVSDDAAALTVAEPFDAVFVFNALHDQAAPDGVFERIRDALVPGGVLLMDEPRVSSNLENNVDNPLAPFTDAVSTLHCLTAFVTRTKAA